MKKIINISTKDYEEIKIIISETNLSYYELKIEDFICYKKYDEIIGFWRIFNIGKNNCELSSLWIEDSFRWKKIWVKIMNDLIKNKFNYKNNLFLACKRELEKYYENSWFKISNNDIPEKLVHTLKWGKENNFDAIIMKFII